MDPGVRFPVHTGKRKTSVYSRLEESPGSFAFAQAVDIIRRYLRSLGVEEPDKALRFRVNPNLSFPPGDMESLTFSGRDKLTRAELTLNLMGLHGAGSPLPTYFTEHVAQHQDDPDALRDFFDIFNHELIAVLYGAWRKYRYYIRYEDGATDDLSRRFFGFIGMGYSRLRETEALNWSRLLAYMGLSPSRATPRVRSKASCGTISGILPCGAPMHTPYCRHSRGSTLSAWRGQHPFGRGLPARRTGAGSNGQIPHRHLGLVLGSLQRLSSRHGYFRRADHAGENRPPFALAI